ncbi:hypothetical protein PAPYR_10210 [Paratrimastix pyriformis]|uniref:EF-hand domain-containing protein n=1 Tax=Paratrimastix pyriformis TaxID=342808 RepID=A0ABQ8UAP7_9EUKA|nr:hypothetical protein PAPYR_10210 [Paratrimastix pyriformis]
MILDIWDADHKKASLGSAYVEIAPLVGQDQPQVRIALKERVQCDTDIDPSPTLISAPGSPRPGRHPVRPMLAAAPGLPPVCVDLPPVAFLPPLASIVSIAPSCITSRPLPLRVLPRHPSTCPHSAKGLISRVFSMHHPPPSSPTHPLYCCIGTPRQGKVPISGTAVFEARYVPKTVLVERFWMTLAQKFDLDASGSLDPNEFALLMAGLGSNLSDEECDQLFTAADVNHDGVVSMEELSSHMGSLRAGHMSHVLRSPFSGRSLAGMTDDEIFAQV